MHYQATIGASICENLRELHLDSTSPWCAQVLDDDPDLLGIIEMPYARSEFRYHRHPPTESIQRGAVLLRQLFERVRLNAEFVVLHGTCFQIIKSPNGLARQM